MCVSWILLDTLRVYFKVVHLLFLPLSTASKIFEVIAMDFSQAKNLNANEIAAIRAKIFQCLEADQGFMDFCRGWMRNGSYTLSRNERFQNQFSRYRSRWQVSFLRAKLTLFKGKGNSGVYEVPMNNGGCFSKSGTHVGRLLVRQQHCVHRELTRERFVTWENWCIFAARRNLIINDISFAQWIQRI